LFSETDNSPPPILQNRGWELVRSDVNYTDMWVLENVTVNPDASTSAPPVVFKPANRLSHVTKQ
jgi:hypothetical protein